MAGQDKAKEESKFSYKDCCNDEAGMHMKYMYVILILNVCNFDFEIYTFKVYPHSIQQNLNLKHVLNENATIQRICFSQFGFPPRYTSII